MAQQKARPLEPRVGRRIDLNADLGEECGDDLAMLATVTSANIACGAHAGSPIVMAETAAAATRGGVAIGAHVSYPDRTSFGRRELVLAPDDLYAHVAAQIGSLAALAGPELRYVKAHGALYNVAADDPRVATTLATAVRDINRRLGLDLAMLVLANSPAVEWTRSIGVRTYTEGFADRAYTFGGRLVARSEPGAVLSDPDAIAEQAVTLARSRTVSSLCVHGDTPGAVHAAQVVRQALENEDFVVRSFIDP